MTGAGLEVDIAASQIVFQLSIGTHFFQAIAKLRALRKMWAKVVIACGGSAAAAKAGKIHVRTSRRILTKVDPWVNLLRNTVCCFAGAVGSADSITTLPLDAAIGLSDEFSRHLARNTQIILQDESHLNREIDPAGGSWFLESLTDQLAEKAWALFQSIESQGGMSQVVTDGWAAAQIRAVQTTREKNLATRKQVETGVSEHPNLYEDKLAHPKPDQKRLRLDASSKLADWRRDHTSAQALAALTDLVAKAPRTLGALTAAAVQAAEAGATIGQMSKVLAGPEGKAVKVEPLAIHPYSVAYEELRGASDRYTERTGRRPMVFLANMGKPSDFIARSTYAMNFLEAGGFEAATNEGFTDAASATESFAKSGAKIAVICSSDKEYETVAEETARKLKASGARTVILAGNPGDKETAYRTAGIDRFIFVRCDVLGTLRDLLHEEGVLA
jgi:methylmalonyl-CoA mutase